MSYDDFSKSPTGGVISPREEIAANGTITVILCSNASTGFSWQETAQIADKSILQQTEHKVIAPAPGSRRGADGEIHREQG
jgi:hypothetical protein